MSFGNVAFSCGAVGIEDFCQFPSNFENIWRIIFYYKVTLKMEHWNLIFTLGSTQDSDLTLPGWWHWKRFCVTLIFWLSSQVKCQNDPKFVPEETDGHVGPLLVAEHLPHSSLVELRRTDFWVAGQCQRVFLRSHRKGDSGYCGISGKDSGTLGVTL